MTRVSMDELVKEVRISIDENAEQTEYMESNADNLELDVIISAKLPEAARDITETAAVELLEPEVMPTELSMNMDYTEDSFEEFFVCTEDGDDIVTDEDEILVFESDKPSGTERSDSGKLTIPDDFLRIVSIKLYGWNRAVSVIAGEGSDIDLMQRNRYTRGTKTKPVCVFSHDSEGKRVIEFFGAGSRIEKALYMPIPKVDADGMLAISRLLRQAIVKRAAGLTLLARGEAERAALFL